MDDTSNCGRFPRPEIYCDRQMLQKLGDAAGTKTPRKTRERSNARDEQVLDLGFMVYGSGLLVILSHRMTPGILLLPGPYDEWGGSDPRIPGKSSRNPRLAKQKLFRV